MRSKTSCFNKTVFRKDLLRFAPVWGVYTLCVVVGIVLLIAWFIAKLIVNFIMKKQIKARLEESRQIRAAAAANLQ